MKKLLNIILLTILLISCNKSNEIVKDNHRIYYEIFVRSFSDSNGDGIGDLKGITNKLDELSRLGIEGIWLTPIFESSSYHKYDVLDFGKIDSEYGTIKDLKELVEKAHSKNIKVIIDFPLNHTAYNHKWFKDIRENKDSKYRDYYNIVDKKDKRYSKKLAILGGTTWHSLDDERAYYAIFWDKMPDLNYDNKELRKTMIDYAKYWVKEADLDGFRIDAAMHLYALKEHKNRYNYDEKNIEFFKEFKENLKQIKDNIYLVGENWTDSRRIAKYYEVFDSNFNFTLSEKLLPYTISSGSSTKISNGLEKIYKQYEKINKEYIDAPFLSNHDQRRIANLVKDKEQQKLLARILLTLPGSPFIYYGEELGMSGNKPDEHIRENYIWKDKYQTNWVEQDYNKQTKSYYEQEKDENSLLNQYIKWINIRKKTSELKYGKYEKLDLKNDSVFSFKMKYQGKEKIVLHNLTNIVQKVNINGEIIELKEYESIIK